MSAWLGILAAFGGVVLGGGISWRIESMRWKREEQTRWHDERRNVYARFLQRADGVANAVYRISDVWDTEGSTINPLERALREGELLEEIQNEIDIIGSQSVRDASRRLTANFAKQIGSYGRSAAGLRCSSLAPRICDIWGNSRIKQDEGRPTWR